MSGVFYLRMSFSSSLTVSIKAIFQSRILSAILNIEFFMLRFLCNKLNAVRKRFSSSYINIKKLSPCWWQPFYVISMDLLSAFGFDGGFDVVEDFFDRACAFDCEVVAFVYVEVVKRLSLSVVNFQTLFDSFQIVVAAA